MNKYVQRSLLEAHCVLGELLADEAALKSISDAGTLLIETFERKSRVFSCGNGGSMCDAIHFAEELTGRYRRDRAALPAIAISDVGHMSCVGNDFGYERVFSRFLEAHGRPGDCLVALSTSGSSVNMLRAAEVAQSLGVSVIALTGRRDAAIGCYSTIHVCTPAYKFADRVQELHIKVLHILIELVERYFFAESYERDD